MPRSDALSRRGRLNALQRHRSPDDPAVLDAKRDLAAERLAEHVHQVVAGFPPLSPSQRSRIAALLRPEGVIASGRRPVPLAQHGAVADPEVAGYS